MLDLTQSPIAAVTPPAAGATLAGRMAPPLRLPGEHFAAALIFWLLGAAGLVWVAPDIARGSFPLPRVAAVTHLFTLGWITTTIQGALYQFLPVALQNPIRWPRVAHLSFALYTPGLALFLVGLLGGRAAIMLPGAALFGTGLLLFAANLGATLRKSPERNLTWWALTGAVVSLVSTVILGVSLAGNLRYGYLGEHRFLAMGVHLHVAVAEVEARRHERHAALPDCESGAWFVHAAATTRLQRLTFPTCRRPRVTAAMAMATD